ncbi:MAG: alanine racemase [Chloroflexi bacterium]|nr:alanine racemase [Chloroflexota bacterium]
MSQDFPVGGEVWFGRPAWAEVDLDAIQHNVRELRRCIGPRPEMLAVVKANAYGHGAVPVAETVLAAGAQRLGVFCADEGVQLRQAGIGVPIHVLGYTPPWEAEKVVRHRLTPTVNSRQLALALARFAAKEGAPLPVHLKVDTGLSRFGLPPQEVEDFARFVAALSSLETEGLFTHFATADEADKAFTRKQFAAFLTVAQRLPPIPFRHVANSATTMDLPEMALDMVRPGIAIYGAYPSPEVGRSLSLKPALALKSRIARLHRLAPGEGVSYGLTWVAQQPTHIALITIGYADGLPRCLSNRGAVLLRGQRAPIIGRICMDQCVVDVTHIPDVSLNDPVVVIGRQGEAEITADEVASLAGTISYEILCGISARVPRVYLRGGRVVRVTTLVEEETPAPSLS